MNKKQKRCLIIALGSVAATGIAGICIHQHNEHTLPQRLLEALKERLSDLGRCDNAWINYEAHKTKLYGETHIGYDGGITIIENDRPVYYEFFIDKNTGETIQLKQKTPPATHA